MNLLTELFAWVWKTSLSATVLVALAIVILMCFRNALPAWARYVIWVLVFIRLMLPAVPQASFSVWNLRKAQTKPEPPLILPPPALAHQPAAQQTANLRNEDFPVLPALWLAGVFLWLGVAIVKHQRLARWIRRQEVCADAKIISLVDAARDAFRVRRPITVICTERFESPAVFGVIQPRLLLPTAFANEATDEELYAILLHEVAHVKCRDTFVNSLCIFLRSLHWFNPAIWYALKRLRRERELFCDALVLARLQPSQRSTYGATLIKIAARLSGAPSPTSLVPVLQHKPEIHRRIHMIAKFKSTPWVLSAAIALVLIIIASLTFTRAAEKSPVSPAPVKQNLKALDALQRELDRQKAQVEQLRDEADRIHTQLNAQSMDVIVAPGPSELVLKMQAQQLEAKAELDRLSLQYDQLTKLSRADLMRSISAVSPDAQLTELAKQRDLTEQKLADLLEDRTAEHPDVKRATRVLKQIQHEIEDRLDGIMIGLQARRDAERAHLKALESSLAQAREHHFQNVRQSRPYLDLLQQLHMQEEILQRLRLRMAEERINRALDDSGDSRGQK